MNEEYTNRQICASPDAIKSIKSSCRLAAAGLSEEQQINALVNLELSIRTYFGIDVREVKVASVFKEDERLIYLNINGIPAANPTTSLPRSYRYYALGNEEIVICSN
ncbi:hypothetical protein HYT57_05360 [Candidatus Woesearchaeota archaeon]|nr:hypothetical protein [Candidatus Woesearchaeota archaeon]